jgi:branched-chain amino acid transport system permease protein
MITLLLGLVIEELISIGFTVNGRKLSLIDGGIPFFNVTLSYNRLISASVAILILFLLWFFINRTRTGKAIIATSMDRLGAALVGIDASKIQLITWAVSGALAGIAGIFLASYIGTSPFAGRFSLVISFTVVILGGLGSIQGSFLAAYLVGYTETITTHFAEDLRGLPSLVILILVLLFRPQGLLGRKE